MKNCISVTGLRGFPDVQGGIETHCEQLYSRISEKGFNVNVYSRKPYAAWKKSVRFKNVSYFPLWTPKKKALEAFYHTFVSIFYARINGDKVMHIHGIGPSLFIPFAKVLGMKTVMTHHGFDYNRKKWGFFAKTILKAGEYFGVKFSNEVIVISNEIKEHIEKKYKRMNTHLIPNGVNIPDKGYEMRGDEFFEKHNIEKKKYIFTAARFVPEKGLTDLINAFIGAKEINNCYKLVIAGEADHATDYSRSIYNLAKSHDNIVLTGYIKGDELKCLFANAALFVLPSYHEGLPISLLEAMSFNLKIVASDIKANLEVGLKDSNYFSTGDVEELSKKLVANLDKSVCCDDFCKILKTKYNWDNIADDVKSIYENLIGCKKTNTKTTAAKSA